MEKIKVLVVEDEIIIADNLCDTLDELGYNPFEPVLNYTEALQLLELEKPDIAILDIELGGKKTGIDLAQKIIDDYDFPFIFLTSSTDKITLDKAKKVMPPAYLVKPFTKEELYTSIEVVLNNHGQVKPKVINSNIIIKNALFIKDKGVYKKISFNDILYLKSSHVYTEIFLKGSRLQVIRGSLNTVIKNLTQDFVRVHRSYIINTEYLQQIDKTTVKVNNETIPISQKYREDLLTIINLV